MLSTVLRKDETLRSLDLTIVVGFTFSLVSSQVNPLLSYLCLKAVLLLTLARLILDRDVYLPDRKILILIFFFLIYQCITSIKSTSPSESFTTVKIRAIYYAAFFAPLVFIDSLKRLKLVIAVFILFTSFISTAEIFFFINDITARNFLPSQYRIGYFAHPITEAEIKMSIITLISMLLISEDEFPLSKLWLWILSVPLVVSFLFTNSRGPFIALVCGLVLIGILKNRTLTYAAVLFTAAYLFIFPVSLNGRVSTIADPYSKSNRARIYMIETGLKISSDNPVFGVGSIGLKNVYEKYKKATITGEGDQLHNNVMQLLVTMGIPGLAIWLLIMAALFLKQIRIYKLTRSNDTLNLIAVCSLASMVQFQICGLMDWNFADYPYVVIFWFMISLAFLAEKFHSAQPATEAVAK